jgi:hypothetical protein
MINKIVEITKRTPKAQVDSFSLTFSLYERAADRASRLAGIVGMMKGTLGTLLMYDELTYEGRLRATQALRDLESEWDSMMGITENQHHDTE